MFSPFKTCRTLAVLLLLFGVGSGCSRATYVFKPNVLAYHGATPAAAVASADVKVLAAEAVATDSVVKVAAGMAAPLPARADATSAVAHSKSSKRKLSRIALAPLEQSVPGKMVARVVKKTMRNQNAAESSRGQSNLKRTLLMVGGVLMVVGIVFFLGALASYSIGPGMTLAAIGVISFLIGLITLIVGLFRKE